MSRRNMLQEVISVLKGVNKKCGITLNSIAEIICEKSNMTVTKNSKTKVLKAIVKGIKNNLITEGNGKFRLASSEHKCSLARIAANKSVPSFVNRSGSINYQLMKAKSLSSSNCGKQKRHKKRIRNNYSARMRKLNNMKNGTKHLSNVHRFLKSKGLMLEDVLDAIVQVREENERLIQDCRNVNKSLKRRYENLKRFKARGWWRAPYQRESSEPRNRKRPVKESQVRITNNSVKGTQDYDGNVNSSMNYNNRQTIADVYTEKNQEEPFQVD